MRTPLILLSLLVSCLSVHGAVPIATVNPNVAVSDPGDGSQQTVVNVLTNAHANDAGQSLVSPVACTLSTMMYITSAQINIQNTNAATAASATTGALVFTPVAALGLTAPGQTQVTCTLTDTAAETSNIVFTLTLNPVNTPPLVTITRNPAVLSVQEDNSANPASPLNPSIISTAFFQIQSYTGTPEPNQEVRTGCVALTGGGLFNATPSVAPVRAAGTGTLTFSLNRDQSGEATIECTHADVDPLNPSFASRSVKTNFKIVVQEVNDPPEVIFKAIAPEVVVEENDLEQTITRDNVASVLAGPNGATELNFQVVCQNTPCPCTTNKDGVFKVTPTLNSQGTVSFVPKPHTAGDINVQCTISDNASPNPLSTTVDFVIRIKEANDPPYAEVLTPVIKVKEDSTEYVNGRPVLSKVAPYPPGATSELLQTLTKPGCITSNTNVFAKDPDLRVDSQSTTGYLSFTLKPYMHTDGKTNRVRVECTLQDSFTPPGQTTVELFIEVEPVNNPPVITIHNDTIIVLEEASVSMDNFAKLTPGPHPNENGQVPLSITCVPDDTNFFSSNFPPKLSSEGVLTFTVARDTIGRSTVSCTVCDAGPPCPSPSDPCIQSGTCTCCSLGVFTVDVQDVNDPPVFTLLNEGRVPVNTGAGAQTVKVMEGTIRPGPPHESSQMVFITCGDVSRPEQFIATGLPMLKSDGNLEFTPDPRGSGEVTVRCTISDNYDPPASRQVTFTIQLGADNQPPTCASTIPSPNTVIATVNQVVKVPDIINVDPGSPSESMQAFEIQCVPENPAIFQSPGFPPRVLSPLNQFKVTVEFMTSIEGTTKVVCTVRDPLIGECFFYVNSRALNRPPIASPRSTVVTVGENTGHHRIFSFMTLSPGLNEPEQEISNVHCTTNKDNLFLGSAPAGMGQDGSGRPSINKGTGTLDFVIKNGFFNVAQQIEVSCKVKDNTNPIGETTATFEIRIVKNWDGKYYDGYDACVGGCVNRAPEATVSLPVVHVNEKISNFFMRRFLVNVRPPVPGQVLTSECSTDKPIMFEGIPVITFGFEGFEYFGHLQFKPALSDTDTAEKTGTANVECRIFAPNGAVKTIRFTVTAEDVNDPPCEFACRVYPNPVVVPRDNPTHIIRNFVTNISPGPASERSQKVTITCEQDSETKYFEDGGFPAIDHEGTLTFIPRKSMEGEVLITCQAADNGQPMMTSHFNFRLGIGGALCSSTPGCLGGVILPGTNWLRIVLRMPMGQFSPLAFKNAVGKVIDLRSTFIIRWVCPDSACPAKQCPTTNTGRRAAQCRDWSLGSEHEFFVLETDENGDEIYVDFDIIGSTAVEDPELYLKNSRDKLHNEILRCHSGRCDLMELSPVNAYVVPAVSVIPDGGSGNPAPRVTPEPVIGDPNVTSPDDSGMSTNTKIIIIVCSVLGGIFLLVIIAVCCCLRKKPKGATKAKSEPSYGGDRSQSYGGYDYGTSYGKSQYSDVYDSQGYDQSYGSNYDYDVLQPGEPVQAMYEDGEYYPGTIHSYDEDGTYTINWADGTHSTGIPAHQVRAE